MRSKQKILRTVFFALSLLFICNVNVWSQSAKPMNDPGNPAITEQVNVLKQEIARYQEKIASGNANKSLTAEQIAELKSQVAIFEEKIQVLTAKANNSEMGSVKESAVEVKKPEPVTLVKPLDKSSENVLVEYKQAQLAFEKAVAENKTGTAEFAKLKEQVEMLALQAEAIQNSQRTSGQGNAAVTMENYVVPAQNMPDTSSDLYKEKARASAKSELMVQAEMLEKQLIDVRSGKISPEEGQRIKIELEKIKLQINEFNNSK